MENRFRDMSAYFTRRRAPSSNQVVNRTQSSLSRSSFARSMSAPQRVLILLIDNGGVDLQIPALVDGLIDALPGSSLIPNSVRKALRELIATEINRPLKDLSRKLLESVELLANRYSAAKPDIYGDVIVLQSGSASYEDLKRQLIAQSVAGKVIDLFILTHGGTDYIAVTGDIDSARIRKIGAEYGRPLSIRSVYMMNCVGSSLNKAWRDIGAQVVSGTKGNNYLPEPSMFFCVGQLETRLVFSRLGCRCLSTDNSTPE